MSNDSTTAMKIGVTDNLRPEPNLQRYLDWILSVEPSVEFVKFSHEKDNLGDANGISGVLLTGGGDVHPEFYGRLDATDKVSGTDRLRDQFELALIDKVLERDIPILAVCRGMQILNVALGGSLLVDLQEAGFEDHTTKEDEDYKHTLHVDPHSLVFFAAGDPEMEVNTYHHQAIDRLGRGLMASAFSSDGVIEAAEWAIKDGMPFLLAVQWHPERSPKDEFSRNIASLFLREVLRTTRLKTPQL
ncbi:MAG TPA: gamma-glutamyl-gamma-aminobutyrate hydrolase [Bacteroidetes bacterium]|nr:gamma-glutamyl-gamma-aminobutyrate hydrolase [Bacteroidota bacterium]